jgi:RNA polymerase sigma-70 factor, ECF subfamily
MHNAHSTPSLMEEQILVKRVIDGESDVFEQLLKPYARKMYVLAHSVLHNEHDAEDVVQESALKAFLYLDRLRCSAAFKSWLLQITINEARMRQRHARRYPGSSIDEDDTASGDGVGAFPGLVDHRENPEQTLQRKEVEDAVDRACGDLPDKYQKVLQLRCQKDWSIAQIGRALHLGKPAVKTRLHRARLQMRKKLLPVFPADHKYRAACMRLS